MALANSCCKNHIIATIFRWVKKEMAPLQASIYWSFKKFFFCHFKKVNKNGAICCVRPALQLANVDSVITVTLSHGVSYHCKLTTDCNYYLFG
jgi:hypothetical protein